MRIIPGSFTEWPKQLILVYNQVSRQPPLENLQLSSKTYKRASNWPRFRTQTQFHQLPASFLVEYPTDSFVERIWSFPFFQLPIDLLRFPRFEKRSCLSPVTIESRFHWTSIKDFPVLPPLGLSSLLSRRFSNVRYGSGDLRGSSQPNLNRGIRHHLPANLFNDEWRGLSTSVEQEDPSSYIAIGFRPNWIRLYKYYGDKPGDLVVSMNRSRLETNRWGRSIGEPHTSGQTLTRYQADTGSDGTKEDDYFWKLCC